MNKKIFYSLFFLCLLAAWGGCTMEPLPDGITEEGTDITVRFAASIPDYSTVATRADASVNNMWLLVFNENGTLITRKLATLSNQTETGGTFAVTLPASTKPRTVHFITNYDWTGFNDAAMMGASEAETVALLTTNTPTYWARVELTSGISASCFDNKMVYLLRNRAKITVESTADNFTLEGFTVHNRPNMGTVAPYDATTGMFTVSTITEAAGLTLQPATVTDISIEEVYLFERFNATANEITTAIVKGEFKGESYYYKIDLIDANSNRYDIERNYHYKVTIKSVVKAGYSSFDDALAGAAQNNTALDPIIEKYPMISDGKSKLQVEKTLVILTKPGESFEVWAKYFPDKDSPAFDNTGVTVTLQQGNTAIDPNSLNFNVATGAITATALNNATGEARIIVSQGELARSIRIVLRQPFLFDPISINGANPGIIEDNWQSKDAILRFNIPDDFPEDLFPHSIKIYTQGLYAAEEGMELEVEGSLIYYIYRATSTGKQVVNFKTNHSDVAETITLIADYFSDGTIYYQPKETIFIGTIEYYNRSWKELSKGHPISISGIDGATIEVIEKGKYQMIVPYPTPRDTKFTITVVRTSGTGTYTQTKTIGEHRDDTSLRLRK